jgi:molybdopterin synthase catalytic subunit
MQLEPANWVHCSVVDIESLRLDLLSALEFVADPAFGGNAMFVGRVRDHNQGRPVVGISYDIFDPLALEVFARSAIAARTEFGAAMKLYVAHAKGRLAVGDIAVVVAVGTPHRDQAFRACRAVIEAVKHQAPVWKQEHYADGDSAWSEGCSLCAAPASSLEEGAIAGHGTPFATCDPR